MQMCRAVTSPSRRVRAAFGAPTVRVYQDYSREIAERAVAARTLELAFKADRMTWIEPSFTWIMYRSGWGRKAGQEAVLSIDIVRKARSGR
jgi:hypothetical protein